MAPFCQYNSHLKIFNIVYHALCSNFAFHIEKWGVPVFTSRPARLAMLCENRRWKNCTKKTAHFQIWFVPAASRYGLNLENMIILALTEAI